MSSFFTENWSILLIASLGLLAIYLLLPRPKRFPILWGASAAVVALLLLCWLVLRVEAFTLESGLFYLFATVAIASGGMLITVTNPARAALSFALVILSTCGLFLLQAAPFLMAATIIVYGGAIIVTFLFVLMLAQQTGPSDADARSREPLLSSITGFVLLIALLATLKLTYRNMESHVENIKQAVLESRQLQQDGLAEEEQEQSQALAKRSAEQVTAFLEWWSKKWKPSKEGDQFPTRARAVLSALENAQLELHSMTSKQQLTADDLKIIESNLEIVWNLASIHQGELRPTYRITPSENRDPGTPIDELSEMSGPRSSRLPSEFRRDKYGRPHLPAQSVAYLGRGLFSDYLLAVELGGLLLLVATVGAIAIAGRGRDTANSESEETA